MPARDWGEIAYTLTDLVIASYNVDTDTFGVPESFADGQMLVSEPQADNDQLRSYGVIARLLTVLTSANISIKGGGLDYSVLALMTGATNTSSGTSGTRVRTSDVPAGGQGLPYFGVLGVAAVEGGGVAVIGHKAVKLDTYPKITFDGEANKYNLAETVGKALPNSATALFRVKTFESTAGWVKPTTGANFLAFFA